MVHACMHPHHELLSIMYNVIAYLNKATLTRRTLQCHVTRRVAGVWAPNRSPSGDIQADPQKFPSGMAALASKIHVAGRGLISSVRFCGQRAAQCGGYATPTVVFWTTCACCTFLRVDP